MNSAHASTTESGDTNKGKGTLNKSIPLSCTVLMDQDGHMDDLIALVVLSQLVGPALSSIIISQGNSEANIAAKTTASLLDYLGQNDVRVGVSAEPAKNNFPDAWRAMSKDFHSVVERFLGKTKPSSSTSVHEAHEKWLNELQTLDSGLVVATGPLTNTSNLIGALPHDLSEKVKIFWMGGALEAAGNVTASDGSQIPAEWNSYADPDAVAKLLKTGIELFIVPLDVTNHFRVSQEMIEEIRSEKTMIAQIVAALLEYSTSKYDYYLWDPIASILAIHPRLAEWNTMSLSVDTSGRNQGRLFRSDRGGMCHVATQIQRSIIMDALCKSLGR